MIVMTHSTAGNGSYRFSGAAWRIRACQSSEVAPSGDNALSICKSRTTHYNLFRLHRQNLPGGGGLSVVD